jgi:hypothetical protein
MRSRETKRSNERTHGFQRHFCSGDVFTCYTVLLVIKTGTRTQRGPAPPGPLRIGVLFPFSETAIDIDRRGKMPFYQVLCIAAHNPEYVRDNPLLFYAFAHLSTLHSVKLKASLA